MTFSLYCRQALWDFLLVALAAIPLSYVVLFSFKSAADFATGPVPAVIAAVLLAVLFGISFNKRTLRIGIPVYILLCAVLLGVLAALGGDVFFIDDMPGNLFVPGAAIVVTVSLAFLLSRRIVGCALLFACGAFACAWVQFLYVGFLIAPTVLFLVASVALIIYRNFQKSVQDATSVRAVSFGTGFATALAATALAAGVGLLVWFAVIAPLNPGALQVKLITEYRSLETQRVIGVSDVYQTPNIEMTSSDATDDERTTDQLLLDDNGKLLTSAPEDANAQTEEQAEGTFTGVAGLSLDSIQDVFDVKSYTQDDWLRFVVVPLLVLLCIVGYFVGRRVVRSRRLARIQQQPPSEQVEELFCFVMSRFSRIGLAVPAGVTLAEFSHGNESHLEPFVTEEGDSFGGLAAAYSAVSYGRGEATQEDADASARFYRNFWKAARKRLGNVRYFLKSFRL